MGEPKHGPLERGEDPTKFVRRFFADVMSDLSADALNRAEAYIHPTFTQFVDGDTIQRERFIRLMRAQKARLETPPHFVWKNLVATAPNASGRVHVTSVHSVSATLRSGASMLQHAVALIEIDVSTGTIIQCDELTRIEPNVAMRQATVPAPFEVPATASKPIGGRSSISRHAIVGSVRASPSSSSPTRSSLDRPQLAAPPAKLARLSPELHAPPGSSENALPETHDEVEDGSARLVGVPLTRGTGVTDFLGGMGLAAGEGAEANGRAWSPLAISDGRALSIGDRTDIYDESDCDSFCSGY